MIHVHACTPVNAAASRVWDIVARFESLAEWHPGVVGSAADGEAPGAVRTVVLQDGTRLRECLTEWDDGGRRYSYVLVDGPLPVRNYKARLEVIETGPATCRLDWQARFDAVEEGQGPALASLLGGNFSAGLANIAAKL